MRILVTGGARSGKSRHAHRLVDAGGPATFVAPGRPVDELDDPDWADRVAHHRSSRPAGWRTVESPDVAGALAQARGPVIVDCLGSWLTAVIDELGLWEAPTSEARVTVEARLGDLCEAVTAHDRIVLVTNEVGSGVVPAHRSGSLFRDLLGAVNQSVAQVCDEVHLVVCGRVLVL